MQDNMSVLANRLLNLQTIENIPRWKKISTGREFIVIEDDSIMQPVWRRWAGEKRENAVVIICKEVRTCMLISELLMESRYMHSADGGCNGDRAIMSELRESVAFDLLAPMTKRTHHVIQLKKIYRGLDGAKFGIANLCETYRRDPNIMARFDPLVVEINAHLEKVGTVLGSLAETFEPFVPRGRI